MTRNREFFRWMNLARTSPSNPLESQRPQSPRRALRRLGVPAAAAALLLIVTQVVLAAPPTADFDFNGSNPVTPKVPDVGETVDFSATVTDPDVGDTHTFAWDFGDGTGTGQNPSHTYSSPGEKSVTLTVTDAPGGETSTPVTKTFRVNAPPTAAITGCDPNPAPNRPFNCTGGGSDPEGPVSLAWDKDGDGFDDGGNSPQSFSFADADTYTIRLRVTDSDGSTDIAEQEVTVGNSAPTATITAVTPLPPQNGNVPHVGQQIRFEGTGTDLNGDNLSFTWSFPGEGTAGGQSVTHAFGSHGPKTVTLTVSDGTDTGTATADVTVNALPVARAGVLNTAREQGQRNDVPLVGQTFALTGGQIPAFPPAPASPGSTDADGANGRPGAPAGEPTYRWDLDNDTQFDDATGESIPFGPIATPGPITVGLEVTDSRGAKATTSLTFNVNSEPTPSFTIEPLTPIIGEEITFNSNSSDTQDNAGQLAYNWDLDDDGNFGEAGSATQVEERGQSVKRSFPTANINPGHRVRLRVTDTGGITREATRNVIVQNTVPRGSIGFSPDAPLPTEPVTFNSSASSPSGKPIQSMEWDFDFPANFDPSTQTFEANASGSTVSQAFSTAGPKRVGLKIQEQGGGFAIVTATVVVNSPPRAGFTVSPPEAFVGDGVTLSSTSSDLDNPIARQDWDLDNDGQFDDANAAVVSASFTRAGTYPLALRVTDSRGATSTATGQVVIRARPILPPPPTPLLSGVVIEGRFLLFRRDTKVKSLRVRAPAGSKISVRCLGKKNCPKPMSKTSKGSKKLPFKKLQRKFRPKTKLIITVTKSGFIGRQTTFTMRRRKPPLRRDLCLNPGAKTATPCPSG
jgi:large repetitive protein